MVTDILVVLEASARHELVDEEALLVLAAVAQEADEVRVAELAQEDDLGEPLAVALEARGVELLDGDGLGVEARAHAGVHEALVHGAEAALAQQEAAGEVVRHAAELAEAERVQLQRARHLPSAAALLLLLLLLHAAVLVAMVVVAADDAGLLASDESRRKDASRRESSDCCGRHRASPSGATAASSPAQHLVADASTGLHGFGIIVVRV